MFLFFYFFLSVTINNKNIENTLKTFIYIICKYIEFYRNIYQENLFSFLVFNNKFYFLK